MRMLKIFHRSKHNSMEKSGPKTKVRKNRRKPFSKSVQKTIGITQSIAILIIFIGVPLWLWESGNVPKLKNASWKMFILGSEKLGLQVENINLEGRDNSSRKKIFQTVGLKRGQAILAISPNNIREKLIKLPWVRDATVERYLPNTLLIRLSERKPMARWQYLGRLVLVDKSGIPISDAKLSRFRRLITVRGKGAPSATPKLIALLATQNRLAKRVKLATRVGSRRWDLKLKNNIQVRLPEHNPLLAWQKLANLNAKLSLLSRDIEIVDMRILNKLLVRPIKREFETIKPKGQKTRS